MLPYHLPIDHTKQILTNWPYIPKWLLYLGTFSYQIWPIKIELGRANRNNYCCLAFYPHISRRYNPLPTNPLWYYTIQFGLQPDTRQSKWISWGILIHLSCRAQQFIGFMNHTRSIHPSFVNQRYILVLLPVDSIASRSSQIRLLNPGSSAAVDFGTEVATEIALHSCSNSTSVNSIFVHGDLYRVFRNQKQSYISQQKIYPFCSKITSVSFRQLPISIEV